MDRAWIKMDRRSPEYEVGVDMFLDFVSRHASDPNQIRCPCLDCGNVKPGTIKTIKDMVVINPYSDMVYYLDSLNPVDIDHGLKGVIDVALRMFNAQKGRNRKNAIWKIIQCPTQPGKVECGYYVMKFMKAIIEDPTILTRSKFNNQSYNQEEIDDVRVEWADLVETLLQDDVE